MAIRFGTKSGAYYVVDTDKGRMQRVSGDMNPRLRLPNAEWHDYEGLSNITPGASVVFHLTGSLYRGTTPVAWVEEFDISEFELESEADAQAAGNDPNGWPYLDTELVNASE